MRERSRRRPVEVGSARRRTVGVRVAVDPRGGGGALAWLRSHIRESIIVASLVASVTAWLHGFFDSVIHDVFPSGADAFCALGETLEYHWPFAAPSAAPDRFTILIASIDRDDVDRTYTRAIGRAFVNRGDVERIETCQVLGLPGFGRDAGISAITTARKWLKQRKADLLIGGEILKKGEAVNLWFIGNDTTQDFQATPFRLEANLLK